MNENDNDDNNYNNGSHNSFDIDNYIFQLF